VPAALSAEALAEAVALAWAGAQTSQSLAEIQLLDNAEKGMRPQRSKSEACGFICRYPGSEGLARIFCRILR
jgi:hypothetical protein